jgi:RNA-directed DNA polymerase
MCNGNAGGVVLASYGGTAALVPPYTTADTDRRRCRLEQAYVWLCRQRAHYPPDADVWSLRWRWPQEKAAIQRALRAGTYRFDPQTIVQRADGETVHLWSARDALVQKAMALVLAERVAVSPRCVHVKDHGGAKAAVDAALAELPARAFVLKTDVAGYYEHIDQYQLLELLARHIPEREVLNLLWQVIRRGLTAGGLYRDVEQGIGRGSPLSPLFAALYLDELDRAMARSDCFYVRYMDDVLVLTDSRWRLRRAVRQVNQILDRLGLEKAPAKTFIGRVERGFDFLGYRFTCDDSGHGSGDGAGWRLAPAAATLERVSARIARLYEQQRKAPDGADVLGQYLRRWLGWYRGGLGGCGSALTDGDAVLTRLLEGLLGPIGR